MVFALVKILYDNITIFHFVFGVSIHISKMRIIFRVIEAQSNFANSCSSFDLLWNEYHSCLSNGIDFYEFFLSRSFKLHERGIYFN